MHEAYEPPAITIVGSVESLTAANHKNHYLDGNYPAGTPSANPITS